jgi:DeoR/GlpR family transcriptional regulator of sugar metabolism
MGTDGYIPGIGFTSGDMLRVEAAKSMMGSARNSIILTDSSKFSEHGVVMQSKFKDIDMVFTDDQIPSEAKEVLEQNGITVEIVPR